MNTQPRSPRMSPRAAHLRERNWQIWLPFGLATVIILALMVLVILTATGAGNNVDQYASISLIFLILPAFMMTFVFLALTAGLAVLVTILIRKIPGIAGRIQSILNRIQQMVNRGAERVASPFIKVQGWGAGWRRAKAAIFRRSSQPVSVNRLK